MGKILIVDDEPQVRQSFEKILSAEGHLVKTPPAARRPWSRFKPRSLTW